MFRLDSDLGARLCLLIGAVVCAACVSDHGAVLFESGELPDAASWVDGGDASTVSSANAASARRASTRARPRDEGDQAVGSSEAASQGKASSEGDAGSSRSDGAVADASDGYDEDAGPESSMSGDDAGMQPPDSADCASEDEHAVCELQADGCSCRCAQGFEDDGSSCADVDECTEGSFDCADDARCVNDLGGYHCECAVGFEGDGHSCMDVDECAQVDNECAPEAMCINEPGSYRCECRAGFSGDGRQCVDIDECAGAPCGEHATCTNTPGGFTCTCNAGFAGDGRACMDIDECTQGAADCAEAATCENTPGGFTCTCNAGFAGDGRACMDIDECAAGTDGCSDDASCTNVPGGFDCVCNPGFEGDGITCAPDAVDECALGTDNCDANAVCTDTADGFVCVCNDGYEGDGVTCADVDECTRGLDDCSENASCDNRPGGYVCVCNSGYEGDGVTCNEASQSCDLSGTFGVLTTLDIEWDPVVFAGLTVIEGGSDTLYSWSLRRQVQEGSTLTAETQACGETSPQLCSTLLGVAFTQEIPVAVYELPSMPRFVGGFDLAEAPAVGGPIRSALETQMLGLSLADPGAAWPPSYSDPAITWIDHDADGQPGVTSIVPETGTSSRCDLPYSALPIPATFELATRVYTGTRTRSQLSGTLVDCDTISGEMLGADGGPPTLDAHVVGCAKTDGSACTAEEVASVDDGVVGAQRIVAARFTLLRLPEATSCEELRQVQFP